MKEYKIISIVYTVILVTVLLFTVSAFLFIPIDVFSWNAGTEETELVPTDISTSGEDVRIFHFSDISWTSGENCLYFISSHQEVTVEADGVILLERKAVPTLWGHSTGYSREYIDIPSGTKDIYITLTACYPAIRNVSMTFYMGTRPELINHLFRNDGFTFIFSILNIYLGIIMLLFGIAMHKRTNVGSSMVYLALFTIIMGIWSVSDNGITSLIIENRAACSFVSFASLSMVGIPLTMFVHRYLEPEDHYVHKVILGLNIVNIILVYSLLVFGIQDMKQSVFLTHIAMLSACFYLLYSLIHMLRKRLLTRRFWVTVCSLLTMCPPLTYSLYMYYYGSLNIDGYGNVMVFVFVTIFALDVSRSIMKDIDEAKEAAIFHELAIKDLLTGCYNRNAYRNDTDGWEDLQNVLLVTCDLNDLKRCNDTLGHAYGDQYITDSAALLKKIFSDYGNVYRIGGDEFCIIIPDRHKCSITVLLAALTEEQLLYNASSKFHMQIACGYAIFDAKTDSNMEDIRIRADELMYQHKKQLKGL
jgi:diguanylate cyclase (GGDEF)-like protein